MSWFNSKFSELTSQECMVDSKENYKFDLGVKGLNKTDQNGRDRRQIFSTFEDNLRKAT